MDKEETLFSPQQQTCRWLLLWQKNINYKFLKCFIINSIKTLWTSNSNNKTFHSIQRNEKVKRLNHPWNIKYCEKVFLFFSQWKVNFQLCSLFNPRFSCNCNKNVIKTFYWFMWMGKLSGMSWKARTS